MSLELLSCFVSWFDFWPSLLLVALNLAENGPWFVPKHDGLCVAAAYFKPGQMSKVELFPE